MIIMLHMRTFLTELCQMSAVQTLVKRAKYGDDNMDMDRSLASNIIAKERFKEAELDADAEYDFDAGIEL